MVAGHVSRSGLLVAPAAKAIMLIVYNDSETLPVAAVEATPGKPYDRT